MTNPSVVRGPWAAMLAAFPAARLAVLLAALPAVAATQERPARALGATPAEFAEPLSAVSSIVELADGRLLVYDSGEKKLGVLDFATGEFRETARQGAGPLEYRFAASLLRMPGDSVMLWDVSNARQLIFAPDGRPVGTRPIGKGGQAAMMGPIARDMDASGRWYSGFQGMALVDKQVQLGATTALVRVSPSAATQDTLHEFAMPPRTPTRADGGVVRVAAPGFPARNAWGVFPDGRVLIVHGEGYVPEVVLPDGTRRKGAAIPYARVPVTEADKAAHVKEIEGRMGRMASMMGAELRTTVNRVEVVPPDPWQTHKPAIIADQVRVDSKGRAWVKVMDRDLAAGERHDLLDAEGRQLDAVRLPRGEKLVALGKGVLYTTREDADGLQYLRRYPLP